MLVLGAALLVVRTMYLDAVPPKALPSDAAAAAFDTLVRLIRTDLVALLMVGLVIAAGAFLTGPSVTAVRIRSGFSAALGSARRGGEYLGLRSGPVGTWVFRHRTPIRAAAVALAALLFVAQGYPTAAAVVLAVVVLLVVLALMELIGNPAP